MRSLALATAAATTAALAVPAAAFGPADRDVGNLDGDRRAEVATTVRLETGTPGFDRTGIQIRDRCRAGPIRIPVAGPQDNLDTLRLPRADTRRGRDVFAELRSGASGRLGEARLVAWRRKRGPTCRRARQLFAYRSDRPTAAPAGTTGEVSFFDAVVRQETESFRGREVVLREQFLTSADPPCCGSVRKRSFYRYSRRRDRYARYDTTVERGRP